MSKFTRRQVLSGATLALATGLTAGAGRNFSALANITLGGKAHLESGHDSLVVIFLRGGADGLNILVPYGEDEYYRLRPTLALPSPKDSKADATARVLDLDGFFGLHPALSPLLPLYKEGKLTPLHAVGSGDQTRSHFEAMATMERGLAQVAGSASGWLARHLNGTAKDVESPLRAVALAETLPDALRGATTAVTLQSLSDFRLVAPIEKDGKSTPSEDRAKAFAGTLGALYHDQNQGIQNTSATDPYQLPVPIERAGKETLSAIDAIQRLDPAHYKPAPNATYPTNELGNGLRQVACLLKGEVGVEVACLDMLGWDTHFGQGRDTGLLPGRLTELGQALGTFAKDLGSHLNRTTVVVMTEFGRRAYENYSLGTDHGRGSFMFLIGGNVVGGKVVTEWPGLAKDKLEAPGDLRVTTDYRDILAEVLQKRAGNPHIDEVFPEYRPNFRNVLR